MDMRPQYFALGPEEGLLMKYRGNNCLSYWTKACQRRMSAFGLSVSGDIKIFLLLETGFSQESPKGDFNWDVKGNFSWARGHHITLTCR